MLGRSLHLSHPRDSIVRKTHALIAQCQNRGGDRTAALATCQAGRVHYPDDAELLFLEANLRKDAGELATAEGLYRRLLTGLDAQHFASVDAGLRGYKGRHNLALAVLAQGRPDEAAVLLRQAVGEQPAFLPGWMVLAEIASRAGDRGECLRIAERMRACGPDGQAEAAHLLAVIGAR